MPHFTRSFCFYKDTEEGVRFSGHKDRFVAFTPRQRPHQSLALTEHLNLKRLTNAHGWRAVAALQTTGIGGISSNAGQGLGQRTFLIDGCKACIARSCIMHDSQSGTVDSMDRPMYCIVGAGLCYAVLSTVGGQIWRRRFLGAPARGFDLDNKETDAT